MHKIHFLIFIVFAFLVYWIVSPAYIPEKVIVEEKIDSTYTISFSAVGDIMCHSTQYNYAWVERDSFDFKPNFKFIKEYLRSKDILFGNLETVLAGDSKKLSGYPFFNSPNQLAEAIKYAGFDFIFTANNHANDMAYDGVKRTIDQLHKENLVHIGTHDLSDEIKNYNTFVRKGLKFGLIAYTYGTNYNENALNPRKYVEFIDTVKIRNDIENLRKENVELVIVYFHFGKEYTKTANKYQKKIVEKTVEAGADVILASHPHVIQPFVKIKGNNSNLDSVLVTYSMGNFISNQRWRYSDGGLVFNFNVTKNIFTDSIYISDVSYLPIWIFKGNTIEGRQYYILPSSDYGDSTYEFLTTADKDSMKKSYNDTIELLTAASFFPRIDSLK